jgi:hypothetical protein
MRLKYRLPAISGWGIAAVVLLLSACGGGGGSGAANSSTSLIEGAGTVQPKPGAPGWAQFAYPASGQLGISSGQAFQWSSVSGAGNYQLQIGSSPGANDVFDSGVIPSNSVTVPNLPASGTLYARVRAIPTAWGTALNADFPRGTYVTFSLDGNVKGAAFVTPKSGATLDADTPIAWQNEPLAQGYRLTLGTSSGGSDLLDTGVIAGTLRVVPELPSGAVVYATLTTYYANNVTRSQTLSFVVGNPLTTTAAMLTVARAVTASVRAMADSDNQPYDTTPLAPVTGSEQSAVADCAAFTTTLLQLLAAAAVPLQSRELAVSFNTNGYDGHALVEVLDSDTQRWITLDPTFGLYALNSQGQPATAAEISAAARAKSFDQLSFAYLTSAGNAYALAYYIDYPLLFLNIYQPGTQTPTQPPPASQQPYMDNMGTAVNGPSSGFYALQCADAAGAASANWDGTVVSYDCANGFTPIFWGLLVATIPGNSSTVAIWRPHRFVF